jgi:hypothetical protein
MPSPLLILDFDGVVNMLGTAGDARRNPDVLGYVTQTELECDEATYQVRYSRELVRRLNEVVGATGAEWLWLTTWNECGVSSINSGIGTTASDWIRWGSDAADAIGVEPAAIEARAAAKYTAIVELINSNPRPIAWIDDEAAAKFRAEDFPLLGGAEILALTPDPRVGITRPELERLEGFLSLHR